jgi:ATP-dependent DNA helicase, uvrD/REP family
LLPVPMRRTHKLEKPYKNEVNIENNPLQDCVATQALFEILDEKWEQTPLNLVQIWINLLSDDEHFNGFLPTKIFWQINLMIKFATKFTMKFKIKSSVRRKNFAKFYPLIHMSAPL